jgi:hypothetical protein
MEKQNRLKLKYINNQLKQIKQDAKIREVELKGKAPTL